MHGTSFWKGVVWMIRNIKQQDSFILLMAFKSQFQFLGMFTNLLQQGFV